MRNEELGMRNEKRKGKREEVVSCSEQCYIYPSTPDSRLPN